MLDNPHDAREQWNAVEDLLKKWLKERRDTLVNYTAIATEIYANTQPQSQTESLKQLCQLLVDYVSAGHFEVFHELIKEAETFNDGGSAIAEGLIPRIADTTEIIMAFDEKYPSESADSTQFSRDMSLLGEALESRYELEDQLIAGLHKVHRVLVHS